jgi:hypothetical protein
VAGRPQTTQNPEILHRKWWGDIGSKNSEMENMNDEQTVFIPPVQLESLTDFKEVADEAAVIVYSPEYFQGPFTDDNEKIRRITLSAVGVLRNGLPLTFRYVLDDVRDLDRIASEILVDLEKRGTVVRGLIDESRPMGELLAAWP